MRIKSDRSQLVLVSGIITALLITAGAAGCSASAAAGTAVQSGYSFTDSAGRLVSLEHRPERVVAAEGSFAEIWTLAGGKVIGIPEDVVTDKRMTVTPEMTITGTIKDPNAEIILGLKPDFVILAEDIESHSKLALILEQNQIPYALFKVEFFADYLQVLKTFTDLTGNPELYELYGSGIEDNIQDTLDRIKDQPRPTVLLIRAFAKGAKAKNAENATGAMLSELGADNIADRYPSLLEDMSLEQVIMEDPDFILITTMGSEEQAMSYLETGIMANPAWNSLSAVDNQHVIVLPKDLFHYKPNARWDEAYEYLAEVLYPEAG